MEIFNFITNLIAIAALVTAIVALRLREPLEVAAVDVEANERIDRLFDIFERLEKQVVELSEEFAATGSSNDARLRGLEARMEQRCEVERVLTGLIHELGRGRADQEDAEDVQAASLARLEKLRGTLAALETIIRDSVAELDRRLGDLENRVAGIDPRAVLPHLKIRKMESRWPSDDRPGA